MCYSFQRCENCCDQEQTLVFWGVTDVYLGQTSHLNISPVAPDNDWWLTMCWFIGHPLFPKDNFFWSFQKSCFEKVGHCLFSSLFITYLAVKAATFSTCLDNTCIYIFLSTKEVTKNVLSAVTSGSANCLACTAADPLLLIHIMDF